MTEQNVLLKYKVKNKYSVFKIYYRKKDGNIGFIKASFIPIWNENEVLDNMKKVSESNDFDKWLFPNEVEEQYSLINIDRRYGSF